MINDFEKLLAVENNTAILKFFLHVSREEQLERFKQRIDDPSRNWKISESDYKEREYWNDYTKAYEDVLNRTSTKHAPWYIIPSNHKWFRNLAISQIIAHTLDDLKMKPPTTTVDLTDIRRKYHEALIRGTARKESQRPEAMTESGECSGGADSRVKKHQARQNQTVLEAQLNCSH